MSFDQFYQQMLKQTNNFQMTYKGCITQVGKEFVCAELFEQSTDVRIGVRIKRNYLPDDVRAGQGLKMQKGFTYQDNHFYQYRSYEVI